MNNCESNQEVPSQTSIKVSGLAIVSFVLGLFFLLLIGPFLLVTFLSVIFLEAYDLTIVLSPLLTLLSVGSSSALVLGLIAMRKIKRSNGTLEGRRLAIGGIILGCFFWVPWLAFVGCSIEIQQTEKRKKLIFPPMKVRIEQTEARKNNSADKYAVIINGDNAARHVRNVSLACNVLKQNGFIDNNIFVLSYQKNTRKEQIPTYAPTFGNLKMLFRLLSEVIDDKDLLFIYGTGHGSRKGDVSEICIRRICRNCKHPHLTTRVSEIEFGYLMEEIHPQYGILVFDQCEAGGFGTKLQRRGNFVVVCRAAQGERGTCRHFVKAFFDAFGDTSSDVDNNGRISIAEAFSKTLQIVNQIDVGYQKHEYTPSIKGSLDANTVYLNGIMDKNNGTVK
ncbi:MAG: DUF4190 domain-containing protein [Planctomycetota bacterium]